MEELKYVSVNPETKSVRERYIRVAAIDIVISEGTWNVYVANSRKKIEAFPQSWCRGRQEHTILNASDISINNL